MRVGIITPIVILLPRSHNAWEVDASVSDLVAVATAADRLGYHHLTASEHVAVPIDVEARRGKRYWDLLSTLSYLAAVTGRIRLATNMIVLPYHHPLEVVKHYGTLDHLSHGRLVLGVGVGSLREEFELLGKDLDGRGARADDAIRAIRASWTQREPRYSGTHYAFDDVVVDPSGVQEHVPIWVGGRTGRSLRRAVALADGWAPFGLRTAELAELLDQARASDEWAKRTQPLEVIVQNDRPLDPAGEPDRVAEQLTKYRDLGATALAARLVHHSLDHYCEQLAALAEVAGKT